MVALEKLTMPRIITLLVSAALIVAGTGLMWSVAHDQPKPYNHRANWALLVFWIVFLLCLLACLFKRESLAVLACGVTLMVSLCLGTVSGSFVNDASFASINYYRVTNQDNDTSDSRKYTAGGILAYAGLLLCLVVTIRIPSPLNVSLTQKLFALVVAASGILGVIVLWSSNAATISNAAYSITIDTTVMTLLLIMYLIMALVSSSTWYNSFNLYFQGFFITRLFLDMFTAAALNDADKDQIYAGFLFCWFATILAVIITLMNCWKSEGLMVQAV
eukprot:m.38050 g.38050  ORF g.38050 m.38050 type:complete len:275 (+) comp11602_c0_seq1:63-887(+)